MQKLYYCLIIVLLTFVSFYEVSSIVTVRLLVKSSNEDYYQCTENLLGDDTHHIFGEIDFSEQNLNVMDSFILMLSGESLESLKSYILRAPREDCIDNVTPLRCSLSSNKAEVLIIEVPKGLSTHFLLLKVVMYVNDVEESYFSQITQLPKIFDFSDIKLNCNNKILGGYVDTVHLPNHEMRIDICCQEAPKPCYVVLSSADVFISSRHCVTYLRNSKEKDFSIGYSVCGHLRLNQFKLMFTNGDSKSSSPTNCQPGNHFHDADILLNNKKLGVDINTLYLPSNEVKLNVCCQAAPYPCNLVLSSKGILITSKSCATYLRNAKENVFFITYSVCGNVRLNLFKLDFMNHNKANNSESKETSPSSTTIIHVTNPPDKSTEVEYIQSGNRTNG
ncbi:hypothetical protein Bpfe_003479 [Biomphalaria pfeifferi]|uniref:Uncharacterized protein n=1 Tax=Biomphalaria pfeifferi TaxID=112525 RepID=A0AAD8C719_BIOPF|nr:hypothetical protein Bpfe_003479 [Biomphalaria pfeifferi]